MNNLNVIKSIIANLETMFVELDAKTVEDSIEWALRRSKKLQEYSNQFVCTTSQDRITKIKTMIDIAGGKVWYEVLTRSDENIIEFVKQNCKAGADRRNAKLAASLEKIGVLEVVGEPELVHTTDGFNGLFIVNTNDGTKRITIKTIYAGGYNVQCFHSRVKVTVK